MRVLLESVIQTAEAAAAAERAGANRLELCVRLEEGGLTPPLALIDAVLNRVSIPVFAMIRPRAGDFVYTAGEFAAALGNLQEARAHGVHGVVFGVLHADGRVDVDRMRSLVDAAGPLPVTFHRAFDAVPDQHAALEGVVAAGVARVLTSGGASTAVEGADRLAALVRQAGDRLAILAGGGVRAHNVRGLVARTGVREVHARFESEADTRALAGLL
jgi:copper homeostasis protein